MRVQVAGALGHCPAERPSTVPRFDRRRPLPAAPRAPPHGRPPRPPPPASSVAPRLARRGRPDGDQHGQKHRAI
eukprot:8957041-Pyramimonas_sp.AAC.1